MLAWGPAKCRVRPSAAAPTATLCRRPCLTSTPAVQAAAFSASAAARASKFQVSTKSSNLNRRLPFGHFRKGKNMHITKDKKKIRAANSGKRPLPGERKAWRKRVFLSNDNALPVPGLRTLDAANMADPESQGAMLAMPEALQDQLRAVDGFKPTQTWGMFRQPSTLIRSETLDLVRQMNEAAAAKKTLRLVITGDRIAGKSTLLLQGLANAYLNNWIVFHVPEAQELTTATTEYAPMPDTDPVQYMQPSYALKMVQALRKANQELLGQLRTVKPHPEIPLYIPIGSPMTVLVNAAKDLDSAWLVFQALWSELLADDAGRPPILFALDGLAHIMRVSDYRSPAFELIHSHDLALVRRFVDLLSGKQTLPNGGAILAATSRGNSPRIASMDLALEQRIARQNLQTPERLAVLGEAEKDLETARQRRDEAAAKLEKLNKAMHEMKQGEEYQKTQRRLGELSDKIAVTDFQILKLQAAQGVQKAVEGISLVKVPEPIQRVREHKKAAKKVLGDLLRQRSLLKKEEKTAETSAKLAAIEKQLIEASKNVKAAQEQVRLLEAPLPIVEEPEALRKAHEAHKDAEKLLMQVFRQNAEARQQQENTAKKASKKKPEADAKTRLDEAWAQVRATKAEEQKQKKLFEAADPLKKLQAAKSAATEAFRALLQEGKQFTALRRQLNEAHAEVQQLNGQLAAARAAHAAARGDGEVPKADPYGKKYDARVDEALRGVRVLPVRNVTKEEARALMEYWARSGMLAARVDEVSVADRWTLGGNGNVGEIERAALLSMRL